MARAIPPVLMGFLRIGGVALGVWATITGFLRKERGYRPVVAYGFLVALFLGLVLYSRYALVAAPPTTYLYLEVGGSLLSFCYAANALVRFRGTHDFDARNSLQQLARLTANALRVRL